MDLSVIFKRLALISFLVPLCGCSSDYVEGVLRISNEGFEGQTEDYHTYKRTVAGLLKSKFLLRSAQVGDVDKIRRQIRIENSRDHLLTVRLPIRGRDPEEVTEMLDKILSAFETNVIHHDLLHRTDKLSRLRQQFQDLYDKIATEHEQIQKLSQLTGRPSSKSMSIEIEKNHQQYLRELLVQLDLNFRANTESGPAVLGPVVTQIKRVKELQLESEEALKEISEEADQESGEVVARRAMLDLYMKNLAQIREEIVDLEMRMNQRPRVEIYQAAAPQDDDD